MIETFIKGALAAGVLTADIRNGEAFSRRGKFKCISTRGYIVGTLHFKKIRKQIKVHQVIWLAAGRVIPAGLMLDHIDRDKTNNSLSNLRLVTPADNSRNRRSYSGSMNPAAKLSTREISALRMRRKAGAPYSRLAGEFGVSKSCVAITCRTFGLGGRRA